jgi:prepilin-type N-terminal cleavage/methylation domain-containing protein
MRMTGFTFIEITAVIAIIGLLAAAAVLSLAHSASKERFESLCAQMQQTDMLVRSAARRSGQTQRLVYDIAHDRIVWPAQNRAAATTMILLPENDVLSIRTVDQAEALGQVEIDFSPGGYSPSYAAKLEVPGSGTGRWMVVAGASGQIFWTEDEKQVETIFQWLDAGGAQTEQDAQFLSGSDAR